MRPSQHEHTAAAHAVAAVAPALRLAVVRAQGPQLVVALDGAERPAARAFSCLVEPREGDEVLVSLAERAHILAVLTRPGIGDAVLSLPDPAGRLSLKAQAVDIAADTALRLQGADVSISGGRIHLLAATVAWLGRTLSLMGERLSASVKRSETVADQVVTRAASRVTVVDGVDSEQLGSRISTVAGLSSESTGSTVITGEQDFRVDAKRITLG